MGFDSQSWVEKKYDELADKGARRYKDTLDEVFKKEESEKKEKWFTKLKFDRKIIDAFLLWKEMKEIKDIVSLDLQEISLKYPSLYEQTLLNKNVFIHDYITGIERKLRQVKPRQKVLKVAQELVEDAENADATTTKVQDLQKVGKQLNIFQEELSKQDIDQAKKIANNITNYLYGQTIDQIVGKTNLQILETFL